MKSPWFSDWAQASITVIEAVALCSVAGKAPLVVSLDGRSGTGKSTLAALVAGEMDAVVVPVDDFYSALISDAEWDQMTVEERWSKIFDWKLSCPCSPDGLLAGIRSTLTPGQTAKESMGSRLGPHRSNQPQSSSSTAPIPQDRSSPTWSVCQY